MSGFSEATLAQKLAELNQTAPSIQGVSLWLLHHRKHYQTYVKVWYKEIGKIKPDQKLPMMYLVNDLVQNSKKKYPEVSKEFGTVMKLVFTHLVGLKLDPKTQQSINRLVNIWKERQTFDKKVLTDIDKVWEKRTSSNETATTEPPLKKKKHDIEETAAGNDVDIGDASDSIMKALDVLKSSSDHDTLEELLSSLPDMSNMCAPDMPPDECKEKLDQLSEAEAQLAEQSKVIQEEIKTRAYLDQLMTNYLHAQRKLLSKKKERLKNCKIKLQCVEDAKCVLESQLLTAAIVDDELEAIPMPGSD